MRMWEKMKKPKKKWKLPEPSPADAPSPVLTPLMPKDEQVSHLIRDDALIARIHLEELPPDEYYDLLGPVLQKKFPGADPTLVEHAVALTAAFDTATSFALSFGIAKFQLGQPKVNGGP